MSQGAVNVIRQVSNLYDLDLSQANVKTGSPTLGAGDSVQVALAGATGAVTFTSGASEVTFTTGTTVISVLQTAVKSLNVKLGSSQNITIEVTNAGIKRGFEFTSILNVKDEYNQ